MRLEVIHLRSSGVDAARLIGTIRASVAGVPGLLQVRFYRHATLASDLAVHLRFAGAADELDARELGARLTSELRQVGQVKHTVWLEEPGAS